MEIDCLFCNAPVPVSPVPATGATCPVCGAAVRLVTDWHLGEAHQLAVEATGVEHPEVFIQPDIDLLEPGACPEQVAAARQLGVVPPDCRLHAVFAWNPDKPLPLSQAARIARKTPAYLRQLCADGVLECTRAPRRRSHYSITRAVLWRFMHPPPKP